MSRFPNPFPSQTPNSRFLNIKNFISFACSFVYSITISFKTISDKREFLTFLPPTPTPTQHVNLHIFLFRRSKHGTLPSPEVIGLCLPTAD